MEEEQEKYVKSLAEFVVRRLEQGASREEVVADLVNDGLDPAQATQFFDFISSRHEARREAGTRDLRCGFLLLIVGGLITVLTWLAVKEGGGRYFVMWGALGVGAFYILRGLYRKLQGAADPGTFWRWLVAGVILMAGLIGGSVAAYKSTVGSSPPQAPDDSYVKLISNDTVWPWLGRATFSGTVENKHKEWSIRNVKVTIRLKDASSRVVSEFSVPVLPIGPNSSRTYSATRTIPSETQTEEVELSWEWVPP